MEEILLKNRIKWIGISFFIVFPFLFLGGVHIGPVSVRMIIAYGLLVYALIHSSTDYLPTRGIQMYFVYLAVYIFVNLLNLTAFTSIFVKDLIAVHFVCCIAIYTFPRIFKTEDSIQGAYFILVFGFLLDAIISILQYQNIPLGWAVGMSINPFDMEEIEEFQTSSDGGFGHAFIPGIMGKVTSNGYFIATMLPAVTYYIWDRFKFKTLWSLIIFALAGLCVFYIQQRMVLVVFIAYLFSIILMKKTSTVAKLSLFFSAVIFLTYSLDYFLAFDYSQIGRLSNLEDKQRGSLFIVFLDFIENSHNLLLGNNQILSPEDKKLFLIIGHNTFTDAMRLGGIFLFLTFIVLFFYLCKTLIAIFLFSRRENDFRTMGMSIGCLCFLLYSQTHSTGVQSGSFMFWVLYMLTLQSNRVKYESIKPEKNEESDECIIKFKN